MELLVSCPELEDTLGLGALLGQSAEPGLVVLLQGALGAGKTALTKGIARGLGIPGWHYVTSPTFAIHNQYQGRLLLHHLDLYRLADAGDLESVGAEEFLYGPDLCVLEWPDSFFDELPADRLLASISWDPDGSRRVSFSASGECANRVLSCLAGLLPRGRSREVVDDL